MRLVIRQSTLPACLAEVHLDENLSGIYATGLVKLTDKMDEICIDGKFSVQEPSEWRVFCIQLLQLDLCWGWLLWQSGSPGPTWNAWLPGILLESHSGLNESTNKPNTANVLPGSLPSQVNSHCTETPVEISDRGMKPLKNKARNKTSWETNKGLVPLKSQKIKPSQLSH